MAMNPYAKRRFRVGFTQGLHMGFGLLSSSEQPLEAALIGPERLPKTTGTQPLQGSDTDTNFPAAKAMIGIHLSLGLRSSKGERLSARRLPF